MKTVSVVLTGDKSKRHTPRARQNFGLHGVCDSQETAIKMSNLFWKVDWEWINETAAYGHGSDRDVWIVQSPVIEDGD